MVKNKKSSLKKSLKKKDLKSKMGRTVKPKDDNSSYESMIENGTSDGSGDSGEETSNIKYEASDDGFSEQETKEEKGRNIPKKAIKPKFEVTSNRTTNNTKQTKVATSSGNKIKPPTLEEINELKETRNLFHSNLFRFQIKEMLEELKIKEKYKNYINKWLSEFKDFLKQMESAAEREDMDNMEWLRQSQLKVPLPLQQLRVQRQKVFQFQFIKPATEPFLIGATATQTLVGPKLVVDICVTMPAECFQKENYLNLVYDQKRAYYLTYIANALLTNKPFVDLNIGQLRFAYYANNPLKPVLEITPPVTAGTGLSQKLVIRLFVAAEERSFKLNRFVPWNNNIRSALFVGDDEDGVDKDSVELATPNYNANVLFDLTIHRNQELLREVFDAHKNLQEGLVLLKVWLRQRQLDIGFSGFSAHMVAMFIAYLFKQRKLHANMSSYQVARNVWNQLALSAWNEAEKGITLSSPNNSSPNQPTLEQFHTYYDVVFIDVTGYHNICSNLSTEMYERVRMEAKLAVNMLNDMKLNSFQLIFMTKYPLYTQFDHILKINKADAIEQILEMHVPPADKYNYAGYTFPQLLKVVSGLLRKGLSRRIHSLLPIEQVIESWPVNAAPAICGEELLLGVILNAEFAFEVLDKGPESIAESASEFRKFWGDKAQLRRFQDGSITESVVWAAVSDSLSKKRLIVRSIVLHLLQHHFQLEESDVEYIGGDFDVVYQLTRAFKVDNLSTKFEIKQDTDAEAASLHVVQAFDDLARKLSNLKELPLEIVSIAGISAVLRYCEPEPILPQARCIAQQFYAKHVQHGIIQLGLSGRWPGELAALRALKTAFYIQIAKLLDEQYKLKCKVTYDGVLVLKQGYCFQLEIAHPKEVGLLKKTKTESGITQYVDCAESIALEKRHYILPKVTGALRALYQVHPSFGPTVMIAKRWLYSQLIDDGLWPDECTELLIASQFLKSNAQCVTNSPQTGFMRFLQLLASTDWKSELFLIDFNNSFEESEMSELEQRFSAERETFPPLCIVTAYDRKHYGDLWTSHQKPNIHVLARVTILARQTLHIIESTLLSDAHFIKPVKIFMAPHEGYDLIIQLKPDNIPNTLAFEFGSPFVDFTKPNWRLPLAGTNFIKSAVNKLREAYSDFAAFFYNPCGGKEIAVIWKPNAFVAKDFKVNEVNGCSLSRDGKRIQAQKETLVEDFKFILKDFYLRMGSVETVREASRVANAKNTFVKSSVKRYFNDFKGPQTTESDKETNLVKKARSTKNNQKRSST